MRAPLLLAVLSFFLLSSPGQVLELYLILARSPWELWPQVVLAVASLAALGFFVTYAGRSLARAADEVTLAPGVRSAPTAVFRTLPIILGVLPFFGAALGLWRALKSTLTEATLGALATISSLKSEPLVTAALQKLRVAGELNLLNPEQLDFERINKRVALIVPPAILDLPEDTAALARAVYIGIALCIACAVALVLIYGRTPRSEIFEPTNRAFHPFVTYAVGAVFVVLTALITCQYFNAGSAANFDFTQIPRGLGALALINVSLISLVYVCSLLTRWSDRHKIPILAPLLVFAVLIST